MANIFKNKEFNEMIRKSIELRDADKIKKFDAKLKLMKNKSISSFGV